MASILDNTEEIRKVKIHEILFWYAYIFVEIGKIHVT